MKPRIAMLAALLAAPALLGCGGAQKSPRAGKEECAAQRSQLEVREQVCDPALFEDLERRAEAWKTACARHIEEADKAAVDARLADSRACAEKERQRIAKLEECKKRISALSGEMECQGKGCEPLLVRVEATRTDCADVDLDALSLNTADNMAKEFNRRIEAEKALEAALGGLKENCSKTKALAEQGEVYQAMETLIAALAAREALTQGPPKGSATEQLKKETIGVCGAVLAPAAAAYAELSERALKQLKRRPAEWLEAYGRLETAAANIEKGAAPVLFAGAADAVPKLVASVQKEKAKLTAREDAARADRIKKSLEAGARDCKKLSKNVARYAKKVDAYSSAGKEKKRSAYAAKLEQAEKALARLKQDIAEGIRAGAVPEKKLGKLVKKLEAAGCQVSETP